LIERVTLDRLIIPREMEGKRLDFALTHLTDLSRNRIKDLLQQQRINISGASSGASLKPSSAVHTGDVFELDIPDTKPTELTAEAIDLDILFEDDYLIVVNKPAHMVVHPSHGHESGTLVHALLHHCPNLPGINGVERPGIVHRLDKDTSGSLVVAKTEETHRKLVELFSTHDIRREYIAWVRGAPTWNHKHIELPIGRHPQHRQKMAVVEQGKIAITDVLVEQRFHDQFSRVRLRLHTGRTHQIRVHLAHHQLPILGDTTYGRLFTPGKQTSQPIRDAIAALNRQALHAEILGFIHPITEQEILCHAPLPVLLKTLDLALSA